MPKMREFLFWNEAGEEHKKEAISLKKAVMSVQSNYKDNLISVEYISKRGQQVTQSVKIPMGRKIRQAMEQEKKRLAKKARLEAMRA